MSWFFWIKDSRALPWIAPASRNCCSTDGHFGSFVNASPYRRVIAAILSLSGYSVYDAYQTSLTPAKEQ